MSDKMVLAKLYLPYLGKGIIDRNRLLSKMENFQDRKATLVVAPAGYGKTVFTKQFVDSAEVPFVWYQLDSFDNDPVQFFQYLINGLTSTISGFHANEPRFSTEDMKYNKNYYNIMVSIVDELQSKVDRGLIIVFDDFHLIKEPEILKFMEHFPKLYPQLHTYNNLLQV